MEPRPGAQVGPYRVDALIARGGMGAVFRATRADGARVALKVLTGGGRDQQARFEREAQLAARLSHPGIVRVHGAGESASPSGLPVNGERSPSGLPVNGERRLWIAMDLVEGEPLDARCGRVAPLEAARLVAQVARALEHAHAHGVLHRDVKPSNVLVRADGVALVTDFGIARALDGSSLTKTGALVGTPVYMAPEQATGRPSTAATDVHGLGVLLHTLITGASPFQREDGAAVLVAVLELRPEPPSASRPEVPAALDRLCLWALEKEPARRPTAGELAAGLEDVAAGRAPSVGARRRAPVVVAVVALGALGAAGVALARSSAPAPAAGVAPVASTPSGAPTRPAVVTSSVEPEPAWVRPFLGSDRVDPLRAAEEGLRGGAAARLAPAVRTRVASAVAARVAAWRAPTAPIIGATDAEQAGARESVERLTLLHLVGRRLDPRHEISDEHRHAINALSVFVKTDRAHEARYLAALVELFPDDLVNLTYYAATGDEARKDVHVLTHGLDVAEQAGDDEAWVALARGLTSTWVALSKEPGRAREVADGFEALLPRALARASAQPRVVSQILDHAATAARQDGRLEVALERLGQALTLDPGRGDFYRSHGGIAVQLHAATRSADYLAAAVEDADAIVDLARRDDDAGLDLIGLVPEVARELVGSGRRSDADALFDRALAGSRPDLAELALDAVRYELSFGAELDEARTARALQELARRLDARIAAHERRAPLDAASRRALDELRERALDAAGRLARGQLDALALHRELSTHPAQEVMAAHRLR